MITTKRSPARKIVEIPELLSIICSFSSRSQCARLSCVSRRFFTAATPMVWEKVKGVHYLIALIPGTEISSAFAKSQLMTHISSIAVPPLPDFTRFDIYAPLVKSLDIYGGSTSYHLVGWNHLTSRKIVLLPKLSSLTIQFTRGSASGYDNQLLWITTFLSPALTEIRALPTTVSTYTRPPMIPAILTSLILKHVVPNCPNLQVLSIFPGFTDEPDEPDDALFAFISLSEPPFYQHIANMLHLRELVGNGQMLGDEALHVIGRLPHLARLEIHTPRVVLSEESTPLPEHSFPALRELALHLTCNLGLQAFWRLGVLTRLNSLEIDLEEHHHDQDDDEGDTWAHEFISFICENSPELVDLKLNFNVHNSTGDFIRNLGNRPMLEALSELPLRTVSLTSAWFGPYDPDIYGYIPTAFSNVIDLHMPGQMASSRELVHFSKIRYLRHLILHLNLNDLVSSNHARVPPVATLLHTLESSVNTGLAGDLVATAQQLLLLWPNLQRVVWPHAKTSIAGRQTCRCIAQSLNGWIAMVREITQLKKHISQKYGPEESAFIDHLPVVEYSNTS